ncbi:hypothetical protein [Arthrobacter sp. StoSoilB20]|uniref:hypothetical protein n=1 Tax=Arthrobacter sp. StoSoilB20 TaxID=2830995 RepID=UPI001CC81C7C|nr:hypothetical protein [Arthrobacter sp. StoSoilB20]BCW60617.1 hypothetical protein StoSoilB20_39640 [Arthrobacter sp. StoSoilB20]
MPFVCHFFFCPALDGGHGSDYGGASEWLSGRPRTQHATVRIKLDDGVARHQRSGPDRFGYSFSARRVQARGCEGEG